MKSTHIPTPVQVLALLEQTDGLPANREDFIQAFKALYPALSDEQRAELLRSILLYVDSLIAPQAEAA